MTRPDRTYAGRMGDSLLDRVTRLPFVIPGDPTGVPASVLLALAPVEGADDLELVLVERPGHLRQHAGQVGLPGGAVEPTDADGVAAALREAQEEVGLDPSGVRVLGSLDRAYLAVSDFDVLPVVGVWDGLAPLTPSPDEVAAILRPTLRQLADPANHGTMAFGDILGEEEMAARSVPGNLASPVFWVDGTLVWGFTAGLLVGFLNSLRLQAPPLPAYWGPPLGPLKEHPMSTPGPDDPQEPSPEPRGPTPPGPEAPRRRSRRPRPAGRGRRWCCCTPSRSTGACGPPGRGARRQLPGDRPRPPRVRGGQDQAVEEAGMDLLADDLARLLDDRGLDRVVLGGLSLGGYVALAFVRRHAGRVSGLVLLDTKATADGDQARDARLEMAERVLAEGNGFVPEAMLPRLLGETSREHRPELVEKVTALILEQAPEAIAGAQRGMAARSATTDVLASIKVPTLVVTGEEDAVTGPEVGRDLAAGIPGARFLLVEEAGHLVNLEQPEIVNEALLDFLAPLWI